MLLAIDIGNTNIVIGIFQKKKLVHHWRVSSRLSLTKDECVLLIQSLLKDAHLDIADIRGVVISSVVPTLTTAFEQMVQQDWGEDPLIVGPGTASTLKILYYDPFQVGADRIANAVAAYTLYGGPIIVVDLGTATTFDVVSAQGEYLGGAIAPGVETSAGELFKRAARIPQVELRRPARVIGKNTEESIRSGVFWGTIGQIDEIVRRIQEEMGLQTKVVATGGFGDFVVPFSKTIQKWNPELTLEGLRILFERNMSATRKRKE